jgi:hypothetical protein
VRKQNTGFTFWIVLVINHGIVSDGVIRNLQYFIPDLHYFLLSSNTSQRRIRKCKIMPIRTYNPKHRNASISFLILLVIASGAAFNNNFPVHHNHKGYAACNNLARRHSYRHRSFSFRNKYHVTNAQKMQAHDERNTYSLGLKPFTMDSLVSEKKEGPEKLDEQLVETVEKVEEDRGRYDQEYHDFAIHRSSFV